MARFKLIPQSLGSGWISLHVAVDEHYAWDETKSEICLTQDAGSAAEVSAEIDDLIKELESLKGLAARKFSGWKGHRASPRKGE